MISTSTVLLRGSFYTRPVLPVVKRFARRWSGNRTNAYGRQFWRVVMNEQHKRPSYWIGDFKHKHLVKTGGDFYGRVPASPQAGMYQGFTDTRKILDGHPKPSRETRHLPIMPLTPRVVYEHRQEKRIDFMKKFNSDRRKLQTMRHHEFWGWYNKLQRVRGRWCKEQGVSSRGVYGPAVDASELWG
jgi:hypothetical protein